MKKTLTIALSMVLVAAIAVTGTLAFLTDKSEVLTNTFTFGNTEVTIAEPKWDAALAENGIDGDMKVVPGQTVAKDPTVTVKGSEEVYVYAYVNNTLAVHVEIGEINKNWVAVDDLPGLYRYNTTVTPAAGGTELEPLFEEVTISETVTQEMLKGDDNPFTDGTITVQAYVHQAKEIGDTPVATADAAAVAFFTKGE